MIPVDKVREIVSKHKLLERELSSDKIDKKKFAKISKDQFKDSVLFDYRLACEVR